MTLRSRLMSRERRGLRIWGGGENRARSLGGGRRRRFWRRRGGERRERNVEMSVRCGVMVREGAATVIAMEDGGVMLMVMGAGERWMRVVCSWMGVRLGVGGWGLGVRGSGFGVRTDLASPNVMGCGYLHLQLTRDGDV